MTDETYIQCTCDTKECKAWCCKGFFVDLQIPSEQSEYMRLHGYDPDRKGRVSIFIHSKCKALTEDNKCSLFGKPERPSICSSFDCKGGDFKRFCKER